MDNNALAITSTAAQRIWGNPDAILLIFAGSAAEFAVNKAVDWLFWTKALPTAPIERFFETVRFAQALAFGDEAEVCTAVRAVNQAHHGVERSRGGQIPQWSYRDVLFMLVDYGERAHAALWQPMTTDEREQFFQSSLAIGRGMGIRDLPASYADYQHMRQAHLRADTARTPFTDRLYSHYREHLGWWRMQLLLDLQGSLVPEHVRLLLGLPHKPRVERLLRLNRLLPGERWRFWLRHIALPHPYAQQLLNLERHTRSENDGTKR